MTNLNLKNEDPTLSKIITEDDEIKEWKHKKEKHDHENFLMPLRFESESYINKHKSVNKQQVVVTAPESLIGTLGLGVGSVLTGSGLAPVGIVCASSIFFIQHIKFAHNWKFFAVETTIY